MPCLNGANSLVIDFPATLKASSTSLSNRFISTFTVCMSRANRMLTSLELSSRHSSQVSIPIESLPWDADHKLAIEMPPNCTYLR